MPKILSSEDTNPFAARIKKDGPPAGLTAEQFAEVIASFGEAKNNQGKVVQSETMLTSGQMAAVKRRLGDVVGTVATKSQMPEGLPAMDREAAAKQPRHWFFLDVGEKSAKPKKKKKVDEAPEPEAEELPAEPEVDDDEEFDTTPLDEDGPASEAPSSDPVDDALKAAGLI